MNPHSLVRSMKSWQSIKTIRVKKCYQFLNTQHESPTCVPINKIHRKFYVDIIASRLEKPILCINENDLGKAWNYSKNER